jgi:hypothetical protein
MFKKLKQFLTKKDREYIVDIEWTPKRNPIRKHYRRHAGIKRNNHFTQMHIAIHNTDNLIDDMINHIKETVNPKAHNFRIVNIFEIKT